MPFSKGKFEELIRELAADFLAHESNRASLITVTRVEADEKGTVAHIFITVFPDDKQTAALDFVKRQRTEFREYLKKNARLMRIPHVDFEIDAGERARQKLDTIL